MSIGVRQDNHNKYNKDRFCVFNNPSVMYRFAVKTKIIIYHSLRYRNNRANESTQMYKLEKDLRLVLTTQVNINSEFRLQIYNN